jgi:hypothetical protein
MATIFTLCILDPVREEQDSSDEHLEGGTT